MKLHKLSIFLTSLISVLAFAACEEDTTSIGSVISKGEVDITIETIEYQLNATAVKIDNFDSKTGNLMLGNLQVDNYGKLDCSFVTRLMCAANLGIPDSIFNLPDFISRVDSCRLILGAQRDEIVGDSLAPQQLTVYKLTQQLPADINNTFNPQGYYDASEPFAVKNYTVSGIAESDSAFYNNAYVDLSVSLPLEFGQQIFKTYKENPSVFAWPQTMAKEFLPGFFVKSTFGNGCVANITSVYVGVYYHALNEKTVTNEEDETTSTVVEHVPYMAVPFTVSPEVLSSNNINYLPSQNIVDINEVNTSDGKVVITTPGGYFAQFTFPADDIIERFQQKNTHLSTVNDLMLYLPAEQFDPDSGIGVAKNMLLIKASEYEEFFAKNKVPDNLSSFTGVYDTDNSRYYFSSMRSYVLDLLSKKEITEDDVTFMLVPVEITTETSNNFYTETSYVVKCVPYSAKPTMTLLDSNKAEVVFSFSTQVID